MTMTIRERETLQSFANKSHASGSLHAVVAVLARVALKEDAIRIAQLPPANVAVAKCARCGVGLFPGDDFYTREDNGAAACWQQAPVPMRNPDKPCFRGRRRYAELFA
jgi:hypothetical protein